MSTIETIESSNYCGPNKCSDCLRDTLNDWLKSAPEPKWTDIVTALKSITVSECSLAATIEAKYCCTHDQDTTEVAVRLGKCKDDVTSQ